VYLDFMILNQIRIPEKMELKFIYKQALLVLSALMLVLSGVRAQSGEAPQQRLPSEKDILIPFHLTAYNNMAVQAILNEKDTVQLMFHTAANALTLTEEAVKRLTTVQFDNATDSIKSWGGQANTSRLSKDNLLQLSGLRWQHVSIWENVNSGQGTDGKFGIDLFENKVIEIDFDRQLIVIHTDLPAKARKYNRLPLVFENDNMFVAADCIIAGQAVKNRFLIHSGYAGALLLDDQFVKDNAVGEKLTVTGEKSLKDSFGNIVKTKKATLPALKIGQTRLTMVPVGFFEGAIGRQKMSILGGDVLKRFNIIIDAQRKFIYLQPGKLKTENYTNS
jgi:hypothetical protein